MGVRRIVGVFIAAAVLLVGLAACRPAWIKDCQDRDCSLKEAARRSEVLVGLHPQDFTAPTQQIIARESSLLVNPGYAWSTVEPERGQWDFGWADLHGDFAHDHDLVQFGGSFAWDGALLDDLPAWVTAITDPAELRAVLRSRARGIFRHEPDLFGINVVNEPLETFGSAPYDNHFRQVLGPDYVAELFRMVDAEAPPWTDLILNEIFVEGNPAKADALVAMVSDLVGRGVPIDAVGLQTHLLVGAPDWADYRDLMERLTALGVDVMVTELDVPVPPDLPDRLTVQADRYRKVVETCLAVDGCTVVNIWGVDDSSTWLESLLGPGWDPLLFDTQRNRKPAYDAVRDTLAGGRL